MVSIDVAHAKQLHSRGTLQMPTEGLVGLLSDSNCVVATEDLSVWLGCAPRMTPTLNNTALKGVAEHVTQLIDHSVL